MTVTMASKRSHYQILGITPEAGEKEIKRAYHRLARQMHPDKASTPEEARRLEAEFAPISRAYNILKDKQKRREYDDVLNNAGKSADSAASHDNGGSHAPDHSGSSVRRQSEVTQGVRTSIGRKAFARGMQFYNIGDYTKAIEYFEAAIRNSDAEALYHAKLAKTLMQARRSFTRAREVALKAIELDPYNTDYRLVLGEICEMAGSHSLAVQAYKDVLRWDAENQKAMLRLAELEGGKKNFLSAFFDRFKK
jgi:curved DNA-binding protein CbpA